MLSSDRSGVLKTLFKRFAFYMTLLDIRCSKETIQKTAVTGTAQLRSESTSDVPSFFLYIISDKVELPRNLWP